MLFFFFATRAMLDVAKNETLLGILRELELKRKKKGMLAVGLLSNGTRRSRPGRILWKFAMATTHREDSKGNQGCGR